MPILNPLVRVRTALLVLTMFAIPIRSGAGQDVPFHVPYLHKPSIHRNLVVFTAGGDLWLGQTSGGHARRLTRESGDETDARFSPDGRHIAFTGMSDGTPEVYVIADTGGIPVRLTYDPFGATVLGWKPDGSAILFQSARENDEPFFRLYSVPTTGGSPTKLPIPAIGTAAMNRDGKRVAYTLPSYNRLWFGYRGGQASDVWLTDLTARTFKRLTNDHAVDTSPIWVQDNLYYLSQRDGYANLYQLKRDGRVAVRHASLYPVRSLDTDGLQIVYELGTGIEVYDPVRGVATRPTFTLDGWEPPTGRNLLAGPWVHPGYLAPDTARIVADARGQIVLTSIRNGISRVIEARPGTRAQMPVWSPDGSEIAFVSDASGDDEIWVLRADGSGQLRQLTHFGVGPLGRPAWSPDGKWIVTADHQLRILLADAINGEHFVVAQGVYPETGSYSSINSSYRFSPDGRWLTYSMPGASDRQIVFLYEIARHRATPVTPPDVAAYAPEFDPEGRYLYFLADRQFDAKRDLVSRTFTFGPRTRVSLVALARATPSPLILESHQNSAISPSRATPVDLDGITARVVDLPFPTGDYTRLAAINDRVLAVSGGDLLGFDLTTAKFLTLKRGVPDFTLASDGRSVLATTGGTFTLLDVSGDTARVAGVASIDSLMIHVDSRAEWGQIFRESARVMSRFYYDSTLGGRDWRAITAKYATQLPAVADRADLNAVLSSLLSELSTSHARVDGGDLSPQPARGPRMGFLGADFAASPSGAGLRIARLLPGDGIDLQVRSPLLSPGLRVSVGDYLLSIDGSPVGANDDLYKRLLGKADKEVTLVLNSVPSVEGSWTVRVRALSEEGRLRQATWGDNRRAYVDRASDGRFGYVHFPTMLRDALQEFGKFYYSNLDKDAIIFDVRNNGGGSVAALLLLQMANKAALYHKPRYGESWTRQGWGYDGKMALLCNEYSGSNAEEFCYGFRRYQLGPIVGSRTEGGVIGSCCGHPLVDGGSVSVSNFAEWDVAGKWIIEGEGVVPDVPVFQDPAAVLQGRDPQLERTVQLLRAQLTEKPLSRPAPPPRRRARPDSRTLPK